MVSSISSYTSSSSAPESLRDVEEAIDTEVANESDATTEPEDDDTAWKSLKSQILAQLESVESWGSFATFERFENFALPNMFVEGVGSLRLPLSSEDAESLLKSRQTREINASEVSFRAMGWQAWLKGVVKTVAEGLGVEGGSVNVEAKLHKMLIYKEGAVFKPIRT